MDSIAFILDRGLGLLPSEHRIDGISSRLLSPLTKTSQWFNHILNDPFDKVITISSWIQRGLSKSAFNTTRNKFDVRGKDEI